MIKGTDEDVKLTVNIIDNCNIKESFLYILALIPMNYIEKMAFCSPLSGSINLVNHLRVYHAIEVHYDLDTLVYMWSNHCQELSLGLPIYTRGQKLLATEYIKPKRNTFADGGTFYDLHSKPKKNKKNVRKISNK